MEFTTAVLLFLVACDERGDGVKNCMEQYRGDIRALIPVEAGAAFISPGEFF